jgi:hypothetical protein
VSAPPTSHHLDEYRNFPYFERAVAEVDGILPPAAIPLRLESVRTLMILAWLRGASWQSHETN